MVSSRSRKKFKKAKKAVEEAEDFANDVLEV